MDTKWMQPAFARSAVRKLLQGMFLAALLIGPQAGAQDVRFEYGGPAYTQMEDRAAMLAAITADIIGQAPPGWGHVVFYRLPSAAPPLALRGDQASLGALPAGEYVVVAVAPGSHEFSVDQGNALGLWIAPDEVHFIRTSEAKDNAPARLHEVDMRNFDRASRHFAGL